MEIEKGRGRRKFTAWRKIEAGAQMRATHVFTSEAQKFQEIKNKTNERLNALKKSLICFIVKTVFTCF